MSVGETNNQSSITASGVPAKIRVLIVPGFVADTYSEIERGLVELCANAGEDVEYLWLVPDISCRHNRFWRPENREKLTEPVWVPNLRRHGIPFFVGCVSKYGLVPNFLLFRKIFKKHRIDAVYTAFGFERFWAAFLGKIFGKVTIWHERWNSLGTRYVLPKRLFYRFIVDEFIAISDFIACTLPRGARVHTIPNATRTDLPQQLDEGEKSQLRRRIGATDSTKIVLMVANFRAWKRHMLAFEICQQVLEKRTDVVFVFLGEGDVRAAFVDRVKSAGLDDYIVAPGYVDNVDDYYAIADIGILTSYYEPFGNVVLETMRQALPLVAFDTGGPAEVIRSGETGFLARDGDAGEFAQRVLELVGDAQLRTVIGEKAREVVRLEYSRDRWIKMLNALFKDTVIEYRKSSPRGA